MGQNKALEPAFCRRSDPGLALEICQFSFSMKHFSGFDNIFETEIYFWGNIKVIWGHLDWGLGTKGPHSDPDYKTFLGLHIINNVSKW